MTKSLQEYMKRMQFFTYLSTWDYENIPTQNSLKGAVT